MRKFRSWFLIGALVLLFALGVACGSEDGGSSATPGGSEPEEPAVGAPIGGSTGLLPNPVTGGATVGAPGVASSSYGIASEGFAYGSAASIYSGSQQAGIWVSGTGRLAVQPDLALLTMGVELRAKTVGEAISEASASMNAVIKALKDRGIQDKDIRTAYFSIQPVYTTKEVFEVGGKYYEQVLLGYQVSNQVSVKIRNLDRVGQIIDDAAKAGGDTTRIQGIGFTIEDTTAHEVKAREAAVLDALAKAQQFAKLTGVTLGKLLYISESGGAVPIYKDYGVRALAAEGAPVSTPISAGELEIQLSVQVVFDIE